MPLLPSDIPISADRWAQLESALIEEFLHSKGLDRAALSRLAENDQRRWLTEASVYASSRLMEVEARARYIAEMHGKAEF